MKFPLALERYSYLQEKLANSTLPENDELVLIQQFKNVRQYLYNTFMMVRLHGGLNNKNQSFEEWVADEIRLKREIDGLNQ